MFPLSQYVNTMCDVLDGAECTTEKLYSAYKLWCTLTGVKKPFTEIQFSKTLRNSDLSLTATRKYNAQGVRERGFIGIRVSNAITNKLNMNNVVGIK